MAEIELTDIFRNRYFKRIIFLLVSFILIWHFYPQASCLLSRDSLDRSARIIARNIRKARLLTVNQEDNYAVDFNLNDNTFALTYPRRRDPRERQIIDEMKVLPKEVEIIKTNFKTVTIVDIEDPDYNRIIFRISFDLDGNSLAEDAFILLGNDRGEVREIFIRNPGGKIEIHKREGEGLLE